jgi:hypothetical protein
MDDTTSSSPPDVTSGAAALPYSSGNSTATSTASTSAHNDAGYTRFGDAPRDAAPKADELVERARQRAHETVDRVATKLASAAQCVQSGVSRAEDAQDEWIESARDTIRLHPLAAVAGAVLIGAALSSLASLGDR